MAHGWSTGIVPLMQRNVLGVRPTAPGFSTWVVRPVVAIAADGGGGRGEDGNQVRRDVTDISWARGVVPTPRGPLYVWWERASAGASSGGGGTTSLALHIVAPPST